jgi:hypothetical protein
MIIVQEPFIIKLPMPHMGRAFRCIFFSETPSKKDAAAPEAERRIDRR